MAALSGDKFKLVDESMRFADVAKLQMLSDHHASFLVVGVLGRQGVGKSRLLSCLHSGIYM
jgi:hypothetical protein